MKYLALIFASMLLFVALADFPVDCRISRDSLEGDWELHVSGQTKPFQCDSFTAEKVMTVNLKYPAEATIDGKKGYWTVVYNQGIWITFEGINYFFFFDYSETEDGYVSHCHRSLPTYGTWHADHIATNQWGCLNAVKKGSNGVDGDHLSTFINVDNWEPRLGHRMTDKKLDYVMDLVTKKSDATFDPDLPSKLGYPRNLDLRQNFSDAEHTVRDQLSCGSCYTFGTLTAFEGTIRIATDNLFEPILSRQELVSCAKAWGQGCQGGFAFLMAHYVRQFGVTEAVNFGYIGNDEISCLRQNRQRTLRRYYTDNVRYLGGHFGACVDESCEAEMITALNEGYVLEVAIQVPDSFVAYSSKAPYAYHAGENDDDHFVATDHSVVVVGYLDYENEDGTVTPCWILQNSWGLHYNHVSGCSATEGCNGYILIERENGGGIAIDKMPVAVDIGRLP